MLEFHGLTKKNSVSLTRYKEIFALQESLYAALYIHSALHGDKAQCLASIKKEVDTIYASNTTKQGLASFRLLISKWLRVKDILEFLFQEPSLYSVKLAIFEILQKDMPIQAKWDAILPSLVTWLDVITDSNLCAMLADEESQLHKLLTFIALLFLDQDESLPPPNLRLRFKKNAFPLVVWMQNKEVSTYVGTFWKASSPLCYKSVLIASLQKHLDKTNSLDENPAHNNIYPANYTNRLPVNLFLQETNQTDEQLLLFQTSPEEGLLSLQKAIYDKFSYEGVHHFLAFIRQVTSLAQSATISFSVKKHVQLLYGTQVNKVKEKKATQLLLQLLELMQNTKVVRLGKENRKLETPFILNYGKETQNNNLQYRLIIDPLFSTGKNKYALGQHLRLIPSSLFQETVRSHPFISSLASYFTGTWLYNIKPIQADKETLLEGAALFQGNHTKKWLLQKLNTELAYMEKKQYIGKAKLEKHNTSYYITAPSFLLSNQTKQASLS